MKRPTQDQLKQLSSLRGHVAINEYLAEAEADYVAKLVEEPSSKRVRQLQGSLYVLRELQKHINHER